MRRLLSPTRLALVCCLISGAAWAEPPATSQCQDTDDAICVLKTDFDKLLTIAEEHRCLETTKPKFEIEDIVIITDVTGRVFYTGADPERPYKLEMNWCQYEVIAEGKVEIIAAMQEPETWGFRFRPKAYLGYLPTRLLVDDATFAEGIDVGLLLDFFYVEWANLNAAVGFRSVGLDLGVDLTRNFGAHVGWAVGWSRPPHNLSTGIYFAF